jgi:FkbM family methyltransferase
MSQSRRETLRKLKQRIGRNPIVFHVYQLLFRVLLEPLNRGHRWEFFKRYLRWYLLDKPRGNTVEITLFNGMKSLVHPDSDSGVSSIFNRNVDYHETVFIRKQLDKGDFIVDAGCNVGNRSLALADLAGGALMIDANPNCIARARENFAINHIPLDNFHFLQRAVGEQPGTVEFPDDDGTCCQNRIGETGPGDGMIQVPMVTLDDAVASIGNPPVAFLKTDLEGYDLSALKGARKLLSSGSLKLVVFERWPSTRLEEFLDYFADFGWEVFAIDSNGIGKSPEQLLASRNLLAMPASPPRD